MGGSRGNSLRVPFLYLFLKLTTVINTPPVATFQRRLLAATCKTKENICVTLKRARTGASIFTEPSLENKVFVAVAIDFVPLSGRDSTICLRVTPINIILGNLLLHRLVPYLGNRRRLKRGKIEDRHKIQKTRRNAAKLGISRQDPARISGVEYFPAYPISALR